MHWHKGKMENELIIKAAIIMRYQQIMRIRAFGKRLVTNGSV